VDPLANRPLLLYAGLLLVTVLLPTFRSRALAAAGLGLAALGIAAEAVGAGVPGGAFSTVNRSLIVAGAAIVGFSAIRAWRERGPAAEGTPAPIPFAVPGPLLLAGLLCTAYGPHLILVAAGIFVTLLSAAAATLRSRRVWWIGVIGFSGILFSAGCFLLFTILGPLGGRMMDLAAGPFSPPAERLLTILFGVGSLAIAGVFPFHRAPWRQSLSPLAALLLARVLLPAFPEGVGDWQAPAMLWLAAAVAVSALSGRWAAAMVAGALLGLWSGRPEGVDSAGILLLFGWLADAGLLPPPRIFAVGRERWSGVWFAVPAAGIPLVLGATLRVQVLISVLALAAAVIALGLESRRRAGADAGPYIPAR
jgi:hypothetical protein